MAGLSESQADGARRKAQRAPSSWYRSFYWRIGLGFVVCVIAVLVVQSVIFGLMMARPGGPPGGAPGRSPNNFATFFATNLESELADDPGLDLRDYLADRSKRMRESVFVVTKDGHVVGAGRGRLSERDRRAALAALASNQMPVPGPPLAFMGLRALVEPPPAAMAAVRVGEEMRAVVVLPAPPVGGVMREMGRMLTGPGLVVLVIITGLAAMFIFRPARQRLRALEEATDRFGSGDLSARAPEKGGDEIARVAHAFNRMAADLSARDEALRTSDRLRRQMLADVSHELNTPLTAMRGYLETLRMPDVSMDAATRERYLQTVERETLRLERIVRDLLDLARYESAAGELDVRPFAVERLFQHIVRRHEHEATTRGIRMRVEVDESADQILGDPDRLEQVLENLVANALRHTPDGGTIELSATSDGEDASLAVVDSGEGIPPEHLAHVFERFYKVDESRHNPSAGSGLGLSIAKAIVERHGGTIGVTSEPGKTVFTIVLPNQSASTNL